MKGKLLNLGIVIVSMIFVVSGCIPAAADSTQQPEDLATRQPTSEAPPAGQATETPTAVDEEPGADLLEPRAALDLALSYFAELHGADAPAADMAWQETIIPADGLVGSQTVEYLSEDGEWTARVSYPVVAPQAIIYEVVLTAPALRQRWTATVNATGQVTRQIAPSSAESVACLYGRIESAPADSAIDDYLILPPEEVRRALDVVGASDALEAQIEALRDSGTYAHVWGYLDREMPGWDGGRLVVTRLRPDEPDEPFVDPTPVAGWLGAIVGTPEMAQFDDAFVMSGSIPFRYGIEGNDAALRAQLAELRDTGSIVRVWGAVTCPAVDFYGAQLLVNRVEIVMTASPRAGYEGWTPYLNAAVGYEVWYPDDCIVMGSDLDRSLTFQGPLVAGEYWPVLAVSHTNSEFYNPPAGTGIEEWLKAMNHPYDEVVEIAGIEMAHARHEGSGQAHSSDQYLFVRDGQLFSLGMLHTGGREDWELYRMFLESFAFRDGG